MKMKSIGVTLQRTYLTKNCKKKNCATHRDLKPLKKTLEISTVAFEICLSVKCTSSNFLKSLFRENLSRKILHFSFAKTKTENLKMFDKNNISFKFLTEYFGFIR